MRRLNFGFNPRTGRHDSSLTPMESVFVGLLWTEHSGKANRISADELVEQFIARLIEKRIIVSPALTSDYWKREIRYLQNHLLKYHQNIPILSISRGGSGGYWVAETEEEAEEFYRTFRRRGLTGLVKAARGKQAALVDMVRQLSFEFDQEDRTGTEYIGFVRPRSATPTPIEIVDAFLEKMTENPEKFADGLRKIGAKYGGILLPRTRIEAIKKQAAKLQKLMETI